MMGCAMALVVPKERKHLSADALLRLVRSGCNTLPDQRSLDAAISLTDALMSAFAMFSLKSPSLLAFSASCKVLSIIASYMPLSIALLPVSGSFEFFI